MKPFCRRCLSSVLAVARREADAELLGRVLVEAALAEELPRRQRRRAWRAARRRTPAATLCASSSRGALRPARAVARRVALLVAQLDAVLVGQPLDGLGEAEPVDLHQEGDDVAALAAAEAVEEPAAGVDVERRGLLVVERAQALQRAAAGGAERDVVGDDLVDPGLLAHLRDVFLADPSGHAAESTAAGLTRSGRIPRDLWGTALT